MSLTFGFSSSRIESRDGPAFAILFGPAQNVDHSINKRVTRNLRADVDNTDDIAIRIQFENAMFVPLTQVANGRRRS